MLLAVAQQQLLVEGHVGARPVLHNDDRAADRLAENRCRVAPPCRLRGRGGRLVAVDSARDVGLEAACSGAKDAVHVE